MVPRPRVFRENRPFLSLLACLSLGFVSLALVILRRDADPAWQDTDGYLSHAIYVAEHGGLIGFLRESFTGTFPFTERHPLYLLMLAPFASQTPDFFWNAKLLNVATGLVVLLTLVWMVARRSGRAAALLAGAAYGISNSLVIASSHVNHEPLFTLSLLFSWWCLTRPQAAPDPAPAGLPGDMPQGAWRWAAAGAWLGIAYMVKSSALLAGLAIGVAVIWHAGWRVVARPQPWALLAAAVLVCSPLLARNLVAFGQPLYEGVNSHIMWLDDWSDLGRGDTVLYYDRFGANTLEVNDLPSLGDLLRRNGPVELGARFLHGVLHEISVVARDALCPPYWLPLWVEAPWAFSILALATLAAWRCRRSWEGRLLIVSSGAFVVFFGWDRMFPDIRYLAPLVPVWIACAAHEATRLVRRVGSERVVARLAAGFVLAFAVVTVGEATLSGKLTKPVPRMAVSPAYLRLTQWLRDNIGAGDRFLLGPTQEFYGLNWMRRDRGFVIQTPTVDSVADFLAYLRKRRVRYIVMHPENVTSTDARYARELGEYFQVDQAGSIFTLRPLPGWQPVARDPGTPSRYVVLRSMDVGGTGAAAR